MISVQVNGQPKIFEESLTIEELLRALEITSPAIAIALNSEVVPHSEFRRVKIRNKDQIEIIHPVGGG